LKEEEAPGKWGRRKRWRRRRRRRRRTCVEGCPPLCVPVFGGMEGGSEGGRVEWTERRFLDDLDQIAAEVRDLTRAGLGCSRSYTIVALPSLIPSAPNLTYPSTYIHTLLNNLFTPNPRRKRGRLRPTRSRKPFKTSTTPPRS